MKTSGLSNSCPNPGSATESGTCTLRRLLRNINLFLFNTTVLTMIEHGAMASTTLLHSPTFRTAGGKACQHVPSIVIRRRKWNFHRMGFRCTEQHTAELRSILEHEKHRREPGNGWKGATVSFAAEEGSTMYCICATSDQEVMPRKFPTVVFESQACMSSRDPRWFY